MSQPGYDQGSQQGGHSAAASVHKPRTGIIIGMVGGAVLLVLGVGTFLVLPKLVSGDKTPASAVAAAQRGEELLASADYGGYYDMHDDEYKAKVAREDFIRTSTCVHASPALKSSDFAVVDAQIDGDTAKVNVALTGGGHGTIELAWQHNQWRYRASGDLSPEVQELYKTSCK